MASEQLKALQRAVAECLVNYAHSSVNIRAKRIVNVLTQHTKESASEAFIYGRDHDDPENLFAHLETSGLLPRTVKEEKFMPVKYYLDSYGWDRPMQIIDPKKLMREYRAPGKKVLPTNFFNASIVNYQGRKWMAYRMDIHPWTKYTRIAICEMDDSWNVIPGTNWLLELHACNYFSEDPRFFMFKDQLYLTYADGCQIGIAEVHPATRRVSGNILLEKPMKLRMEKNWMFFQDGEYLRMVYKIQPHTTYRVSYDSKVWDKIMCNNDLSTWKWGEMRGSTCPVLVKREDSEFTARDYFFAFFHSHIEFPPKMKGFIHRQYHVGAYLFSPEPPFEIVAYSREPIISGPYIHPHIPHGGNHNFNIFPCGSVFENGQWVISCGINDHEIGLLRISHEDLCGNLEWI